MRARRCLVALSVKVLLVTTSTRLRAQDLPPPDPLAAAPMTPVTARLDGPPMWQRLALGLSVGAAGVGLVLGVGAKLAESQKIREFNDYRRTGDGAAPGLHVCSVGAPNAGPPGCAQMLAEADRARRWSIAGFAASGTFALTALVLFLVSDDDEPVPLHSFRPTRPSPTLACGPGPGLSGGCGVRF
jgi:hypothetical protein